jgi:hypothetical protein
MARQVALPPTVTPRLLGRTAAASYVSVSPVTFDEMVKRGMMPRPKVLIGTRKAWDIRQLDEAVDALPADTEIRPDAGDTTWDDVDAAKAVTPIR